jgi:hypothetical protein
MALILRGRRLSGLSLSVIVPGNTGSWRIRRQVLSARTAR